MSSGIDRIPSRPAKQMVVEDEMDKMLALEVIEESKSPWSNRPTVVSRPGKDRFRIARSDH